MPGSIRSLHLKPETPSKAGDYDLDAFVVEYTDDAAHFDFRLELGRVFDILWALPAAVHDRLRLIQVDAAVHAVDEPTLRADPFTCDVAELRWQGELATLACGDTIVSVRFRASASPAAYRCEIGLRSPAGATTLRVLEWAVV